MNEQPENWSSSSYANVRFVRRAASQGYVTQSSFFEVGLHKFNVFHTQRLRQLVQSDHGRIAPPAFKATEILLAEARTFFHLLLRQALLPSQAGKVPANQFAHIHAQTVRGLHTLSL